MQKPLPGSQLPLGTGQLAGWLLQTRASAEPECQPQLVAEEPPWFPLPSRSHTDCPSGRTGLHSDPGHKYDQGLQASSPSTTRERVKEVALDVQPQETVSGLGWEGKHIHSFAYSTTNKRMNEAPTPYGCCSGAQNTTVTKQARSLLSQSLHES